MLHFFNHRFLCVSSANVYYSICKSIVKMFFFNTTIKIVSLAKKRGCQLIVSGKQQPIYRISVGREIFLTLLLLL